MEYVLIVETDNSISCSGAYNFYEGLGRMVNEMLEFERKVLDIGYQLKSKTDLEKNDDGFYWLREYIRNDAYEKVEFHLLRMTK